MHTSMLLRAAAALLVAVSSRGAAAQAAPRALVLAPASATYEHEFDGIWAIRELSDGLLLVADREGLHALEPRSGAVRRVGARGRGPGEFLEVGNMIALADDTTLFADRSNRRLVYLHRDRVVRVTEANDAVTAVLGTSLLGGDTGGRLLASRTIPNAVPFATEREVGAVAIVRFDPRASRVDTVTVARGEEIAVSRVGTGPGASVRTMTVVFASSDLAWLMPDGWIMVARQSPYRVDWHPPTGPPRLGAPIERTAPAVDEAEKADWQRKTEALNGKPLSIPLSALAWAERVAPFVSAPPFPVAGGSVLIRRMPWSGSRGTEYDLVDRAGARVGQLRLGPEERVVGSVPGAVFVAARDADGIDRLRRHPWR